MLTSLFNCSTVNLAHTLCSCELGQQAVTMAFELLKIVCFDSESSTRCDQVFEPRKASVVLLIEKSLQLDNSNIGLYKLYSKIVMFHARFHKILERG